jgi:hypothetical protein
MESEAMEMISMDGTNLGRRAQDFEKLDFA